MTQEKYRLLNPGLAIIPEKGAVVCVKGELASTEEHLEDLHGGSAFHYFWPIALASMLGMGLLLGLVVKWLSGRHAQGPSKAAAAAAGGPKEHHHANHRKSAEHKEHGVVVSAADEGAV